MRSVVDRNVVMRRIPVYDYGERKTTWRKARKEREKERGKRYRGKSVEGIKIKKKKKRDQQRRKETLKINAQYYEYNNRAGIAQSVWWLATEWRVQRSNPVRERIFLYSKISRPALRYTLHGQGDRRVALTTHLHLAQRLSMCGPIPFVFCGAATQRWSWPPHSWGFLDHTHNDAPQSVGLWTSDQLVAETSTWERTTLTTDKYPCPRWDSNPRSQQASGLLRFHFIDNLSRGSAHTLLKPASWSSGKEARLKANGSPV